MPVKPCGDYPIGREHPEWLGKQRLPAKRRLVLPSQLGKVRSC